MRCLAVKIVPVAVAVMGLSACSSGLDTAADLGAGGGPSDVPSALGATSEIDEATAVVRGAGRVSPDVVGIEFEAKVTVGPMDMLKMSGMIDNESDGSKASALVVTEFQEHVDPIEQLTSTLVDGTLYMEGTGVPGKEGRLFANMTPENFDEFRTGAGFGIISALEHVKEAWILDTTTNGDLTLDTYMFTSDRKTSEKFFKRQFDLAEVPPGAVSGGVSLDRESFPRMIWIETDYASLLGLDRSEADAMAQEWGSTRLRIMTTFTPRFEKVTVDAPDISTFEPAGDSSGG